LAVFKTRSQTWSHVHINKSGGRTEDEVVTESISIFLFPQTSLSYQHAFGKCVPTHVSSSHTILGIPPYSRRIHSRGVRE